MVLVLPLVPVTGNLWAALTLSLLEPTLFGAWLWWQLGSQSGIDYFTGFVVEKSLSMDNVFVIAMIFSFFAIPRQYQHRVLFWGSPRFQCNNWRYANPALARGWCW